MAQRRQRQAASVKDIKSSEAQNSKDIRGIHEMVITKIISRTKEIEGQEFLMENAEIYVAFPNKTDKEYQLQTLNIVDSKGEVGTGNVMFTGIEVLTGYAKLESNGEITGGADVLENGGVDKVWNFDKKGWDEVPVDIYSIVGANIGVCFDYYLKTKNAAFNGYTGDKIEMPKDDARARAAIMNDYMTVWLPDYAYCKDFAEWYADQKNEKGFNTKINRVYRGAHFLCPQTHRTFTEIVDGIETPETALKWKKGLKEINPEFHFSLEKLDEKRMEALKRNIERHNKQTGENVEFSEADFIKHDEMSKWSVNPVASVNDITEDDIAF